MKNRNEKNARKITLIVNLIGLLLFFGIIVGITAFIWPYIKDFIFNEGAFSDFVEENGAVSIFLYLALQVIQVVVAVIPGEILEVAAGAAFGWFFGLIAAEIGIAVGTAVIFVVLKKVGKPFLYAAMGEKSLKRFEKLNNHPKRDKVLFLIFFIPGLPKDLLTYAAAFFDISLWRFLLITLIARIPSIITSTIAGKMIINGNIASAVVIFVITGAVAVIGFIFSEKIMNWLQNFREHKKERKQENESEPSEISSGGIDKD